MSMWYHFDCGGDTLSDTKRLPIAFNSLSLKNLDKICEKLNLSRPKVMSYLFSGDKEKIEFVVNELKRVHELF